MSATPLSPEKIHEALADLPGWTYQRTALEKVFEFATFREALGFMVRGGFDAESLNHHPEWTNIYNLVIVRLNTHSADHQVTAKDVELAHRLQKVSWVG